jgi:hypothetical protein
MCLKTIGYLNVGAAIGRPRFCKKGYNVSNGKKIAPSRFHVTLKCFLSENIKKSLYL